MEWFVWLAPVPVSSIPTADALRFEVATPVLAYLALVAACTPLLLALRDRFRGSKTTLELPRLRVLEGRKELRRRAA